MRLLISFATAAVSTVCLAGTISAEPVPVETIRALTEENKKSAIALYREFLSLPNDANYPDDILSMVEWMEGTFEAMDFSTQRIATAGSPLLLAERHVSDEAKTVLIYLQSDGQPVDPSAWFQEDPYTPVLKERTESGAYERIPWDLLDSSYDPDWRVFARSASDSKGPMTQFMVAMDLLDQAGFEPAFNIKVIIDTEEEMGSPNLPDAVAANRDLLAADMLLIFDGPPHPSNMPTVGFGARGIVTITLVTHGPKVPQHSGHYGNFVPNPAFHMARILSSMKSPDGRVLLPGFYDGVTISDEVRAVLEAVPDDEEQILGDMGLIKHDAVAPSLQEAIQYPSLNIRGLSSGWVGKESRTIIPATATAEIDMRLVKESDYQYLLGLVRSHIEHLGYHVIEVIRLIVLTWMPPRGCLHVRACAICTEKNRFLFARPADRYRYPRLSRHSECPRPKYRRLTSTTISTARTKTFDSAILSRALQS
jgi:acetylornithine deacetylase/succinyl-diaminopimelate desuccinylase-like protein